MAADDRAARTGRRGGGHGHRAGLRPGGVWFDAPGDGQTLETSGSGYLGGFPLRLLTGYRPELIGASLGLVAVPEDQIALVGARDLDPPEVTYLAAAAIRQRTVTDLTDLPAGPLYLHLDLDVIDPAALPGMRYPASGGPGIDTVTAAVGQLLASGAVAALGLACVWQPGAVAVDQLRTSLEGVIAQW